MTDRTLRLATAALVLIGGAIHLVEWFDLLRNIPKIGPLFLANAATAVVVSVLLVIRGVRTQWAGILGAIVLSLGTLVGFLLARYGTFLEYNEPRWRATAVIAALVEVATVATASAAAVRRVRERGTGQAASG